MSLKFACKCGGTISKKSEYAEFLCDQCDVMDGRLSVPLLVPTIKGDPGKWNDVRDVLPRPDQKVLALFAHDPDNVQTHTIVERFAPDDAGLCPIIKPVLFWMRMPALPSQAVKQSKPDSKQLWLF